MKALVVEDDVTLRALYADVLTRRGYEVRACNDAESALNACRKESYHLAILDWTLPEMDGVELCRRVRRLPQWDRNVILMISGRNEPDDIVRVMDAGADDYLAKPVTLALLNSRLTIAEELVKSRAEKMRTEEYACEQNERLKLELRSGVRKLASSEESFRAIFQESPLAMAVVDSNERNHEPNGGRTVGDAWRSPDQVALWKDDDQGTAKET